MWNRLMVWLGFRKPVGGPNFKVVVDSVWLDAWAAGYNDARHNNVNESPSGSKKYQTGYREGARAYWDYETDQ